MEEHGRDEFRAEIGVDELRVPDAARNLLPPTVGGIGRPERPGQAQPGERLAAEGPAQPLGRVVQHDDVADWLGRVRCGRPGPRDELGVLGQRGVDQDREREPVVARGLRGGDHQREPQLGDQLWRPEHVPQRQGLRGPQRLGRRQVSGGRIRRRLVSLRCAAPPPDKVALLGGEGAERA